MFSTGQWIFAALFVLVFTVIIIKSYRKDRKLHEKNYKGVVWVGTVFVIFVIILFLIKHLLRN
jgi:cytochrome bd-type quinol oxidase subunit 1